MAELKTIIADNIQALRRAYPLTQAELAQKLNYSDKAVSKWERGESVPDIGVLCEIAALFGVSVDYLVKSHEGEKIKTPHRHISLRNRWTITLLSVVLVWLLATIAIIVVKICVRDFAYTGVILAGAGIISLIVLLVFNSIWGKAALNYLIISLLMWGMLAALYFILFPDSPILFGIGVPGQAIIVLWSFLRIKKKRKVE